MLLSADIFALINYFSFILWATVGACVLGMLILRRTKPDLPRPIKLPLWLPVLFLAACTLLVIVPAIYEPMDSRKQSFLWIISLKFIFIIKFSVIGVLITLTGVPVYYICIKGQNKFPFLLKWTGASNILICGVVGIFEKLFLIFLQIN
jgi:solute carrier family 7 (L-type amino acid transporter), member 5